MKILHAIIIVDDDLPIVADEGDSIHQCFFITLDQLPPEIREWADTRLCRFDPFKIDDENSLIKWIGGKNPSQQAE